MAKTIRGTITEKHNEANRILKAIAAPYLKNKPTTVYKNIAKIVGRSHITISNYIKGDGKDGFTTEGIIEAFKEYNPLNK